MTGLSGKSRKHLSSKIDFLRAPKSCCNIGLYDCSLEGQREENRGKEFDVVQKVWRGTAVEEKKSRRAIGVRNGVRGGKIND